MKAKTIFPIVLAGGKGSRIWPLSRTFHPKQFLKFSSELSSFQQTILRLKSITAKNFCDPIVICHSVHIDLVKQQLGEINGKVTSIILEPFSKNTGPAISISSLFISKKFSKEAYILAIPSDHSIQDNEAFEKALSLGKKEVGENSLVTFGVKPTSSHSGYGYLELGKENEAGVFEGLSFHEKPKKEIAKSYIEKDSYLWNSGIFLFHSTSFLSLLKKVNKDLLRFYSFKEKNTKNDNFPIWAVDEELYKNSPNFSFDDLIMNNLLSEVDLKVIPFNVNWKDLGSWNSFWEFSEKDMDGNAKSGNILTRKVKNSFLYSEDETLVAMGVEDLIVINTPDALLVANKNNSEEVKVLVEQLVNEEDLDIDLPRKVTRPWGTYDSLDESGTFKVKKIVVNPGEKLSLQFHKKRSETWIVVKGKASVEIDNVIKILRKGQIIHIPVGARHRLENNESEELVLIEVQIGSYLGEDDIERIEDSYGRA